MPLAFVTGWPVKHSRSPIIHRYWLKKYGIAGDYRAEAVEPTGFADFIAALKQPASIFRGGNVTIPHKEMALALADRPDELAQEIGAANTLWMADGALHAMNTDSYGFTANLDQARPGWDRASTAVILGAGGASRAVIQSLRDRGLSEIHVVNRTLPRARELSDRFGSHVIAHAWEELQEVLVGAGLFVNTTSLGMDGSAAPMIDFGRLASDALVTDIVYVPLKTPFMLQAEEQGFDTVDGLGMLLHQATPGFEKWFGARPEVDSDLRALVVADLEKHT